MTETETPEKVVAFDLSNIDSTVSPCENFYQYAVGNWMKNNPVPSTESRWSSFNILHKENQKKLESLILEANKKEDAHKGSDAQLIRDLYRSAMDSNLLEKKGITALKPLMEEISAVSSKEQLSSVIGKLKTIGVSTPVGLYVSRDDKNSEQYITTITQSGLTLPDRQYYISQEDKYKTIRTQYIEHINKMFELAGMVSRTSADKILAVETAIAKAQWDRTELREPEKNYNKMTLVQAQSKLRFVSLPAIIKELNMASFDTLIVGQPSYFEAMDKAVGALDLQSWKDYLLWKLIDGHAPWANKAFEDEHFKFFSTQLRGVKEKKPRLERVVEMIDGELGEPLGKLYVEKYFSAKSKEYMSQLIENLRSAYRVRIKNLTWMSAETKEKALKKLESFTYKIGYPDEWKDYTKLEVTPNDLLTNFMNITKYQMRFMLDRLDKPVDKKEWFMSPQTVNAYYNPNGNEVVFPAGILQPPFYHPDFDDAINYGGIGAVIGHEFTHGFDDKGSMSDWDGNLNNWWTDSDRKEFDALTGALAEQFDAYEPIAGMHVNGKMTLGENIADLGGLTLAYAALETKLAGKDVPEIDGFNWQQRFFLGWANIWKMTTTEEELRNRLNTDYHSPGEYRVLGPLVNLPQFHQAFGCTNQAMVKPDSSLIKIW